MDRDLIDKFRGKANEHSYCQRKYSCINGKNLWHCICSAMDWITVGVTNIDFHPDLQLFGHNEEKTLGILMLLMQVAMIKEGIEQLHRVLANTDGIYLNTDTSIWGDNPYFQTDNEYFETLRACFGAHPVNLKGFKGIENEKKRFASWPFVAINGFEVLLYPSTSTGCDLALNISFDQLERYAIKRYCHLRDLISLIDTDMAEENLRGGKL